jgi:GT2 family glycosyltransferase
MMTDRMTDTTDATDPYLPVHIVIPVRDNLDVTAALVEQIEKERGWETCWILDNGSVDNTPLYLKGLEDEDPRFRAVKCHGGVYDCWDMGVRLAMEEGASLVCILNNDVVLAKGTFTHLAGPFGNPRVAITYPNYDLALEAGCGAVGVRHTHGTFRHGGMSGFAFMIRTIMLDWLDQEPLIDPRFKWWYGDDDLAFRLEAAGWLQTRVLGLPIEHTGGATTALHPEVQETITADQAHCQQKWGK